jgi:dTDP-4-dehydrorhamnose reductase
MAARWLITGAAGQLGTDLLGVLGEQSADVTGIDLADLDLTDATAVTAYLDAAQPTIVINCAAYTAVDKAEANEPIAAQINGAAPGHLAGWCAANGTRLIHLSTDYVFDGHATTPYDVDHRVDPQSAYGRTKAAGERAVLDAGGDGHVVRTAWVYGAQGAGPPNFVKTMSRLARERETVSVVGDQLGSPTWTWHLARSLVALGTADVPAGIWHCTGSGQCSWAEFAQAIFSELGVDPARVQPITTAEYPTAATRPAYSVLSHRTWDDAGLPPMPDWREALHEAFATVGAAFVA